MSISTEQIQLYWGLQRLADNTEAFYHSDVEIEDGSYFRTFSYRLASYSDFLQYGALEARGIMFHITNLGEPLELLCRPQTKFFNVNENPMTMDLDFSQVKAVYIKEDGSLISTYLHPLIADGEAYGSLRVKSKTSIKSEQAVAAQAYIDAHPKLKHRLHFLTAAGWTVNCEWTAPDNRIVVGYPVAKLIILNARRRDTGETLDHETLEAHFGDHLVPRIATEMTAEELETMRGDTDYEGVILQFNSDYKVEFAKFKNDWYLFRHRTKDSVNNAGALFDCVLHEGIDDLRTLFVTDVVAMQRIAEMETLVTTLYNRYVNTTEAFYQENKRLERKDYAIKAQAFRGEGALGHLIFGSAMNLYVKRDPKYKELLAKAKKSFIKVADVSVEEN